MQVLALTVVTCMMGGVVQGHTQGPSFDYWVSAKEGMGRPYERLVGLRDG